MYVKKTQLSGCYTVHTMRRNRIFLFESLQEKMKKMDEEISLETHEKDYMLSRNSHFYFPIISKRKTINFSFKFNLFMTFLNVE